MTGIGTGAVGSVAPAQMMSIENRLALHPAIEKTAAEAVAKAAVEQVELAKYFSPRVSFDQQAGIFIVEFRNNQTGEVELQIPPDRVVREYQRIQQSRDSDAALQGSADRTATADPGGTDGVAAPRPDTGDGDDPASAPRSSGSTPNASPNAESKLLV